MVNEFEFKLLGTQFYILTHPDTTWRQIIPYIKREKILKFGKKTTQNEKKNAGNHWWVSNKIGNKTSQNEKDCI